MILASSISILVILVSKKKAPKPLFPNFELSKKKQAPGSFFPMDTKKASVRGFLDETGGRLPKEFR